MQNLRVKNSIPIIVFAICAGVFLSAVIGYAEDNVTSITRNNAIEVTVEFLEPAITKVDGYHRVEMEGVYSLGNPGEPILPVEGVNILIPAGKEIRDSQVVLGKKVAIPGKYIVEPGQEPIPLSFTGKVEKTPPKDEIYKSKNPFPSKRKKKVTTQMMRGYEIAIFNLFPMKYIPQEGKLSYYKNIILKIHLESEKRLKVEKKIMGEPKKIPRKRPKLRKLIKDKKRLERFIVNPQDIPSYDTLSENGDIQPLGDEGVDGGIAPVGGEGGDVGIMGVDPAESYQYVIITSETLAVANVEDPDIPGDVSGAYSFQDLINSKIARGVTATIVTTEWIYANYDGTRPDGGTDNATRIRNFIIDAYNNWEIDHVLLGGDGCSEDEAQELEDFVIPARLLWVGFDLVRQGGGYVYVDRLAASDLYYACLNGTFDGDRDGMYGEKNDGSTGFEIDLVAEVFVGRASVATAEEVSNFVRKTLAYESSTSPYLEKSYMLGEYMGSNFGKYPHCYSFTEMEEIRKGSDAHEYTTKGFQDSGYFQPDVLYDTESYRWSKSELMDIMNEGVCILSHFGHSSEYSNMHMHRYDVDALTNSEYFFVYTGGCYAGAFDNVPSIGGYQEQDCIAEYFTIAPCGAFGYIANSRYGWDVVGSTKGSSQYFARQFWDAVFGKDILAIGEANQDSKEDNLPYIRWSKNRYCYLELNLFGDPEISFHVTPSSKRAKITEPKYGYYKKNTIDIYGTATGNGFLNYIVEYGLGREPDAWTELINSTTPVVDNVLTQFDTSIVVDGEYTIRLICSYQDGTTFEDRILIVIKGLYISGPKQPTSSSYDIYNCYDTIEITGRAVGTGFINYTISYAWSEYPNGEPSVWSTEHIELVDNGESPIETGTLGYFHIEDVGITEAGIITLKVDLHTQYFDDSEETSIYVDPRLHRGWPLKGKKRIFGIPYDVDNDGLGEIVARRGSGVAIYSHDGIILPGFPKTSTSGFGWPRFNATVGDMNNDGLAETVFAFESDGSYIYIFDSAGWSRKIKVLYNARRVSLDGNLCTLARLDDDNSLELLVGTSAGIYAFNRDGSGVEGWQPMRLNGINLKGRRATGDVDNDGKDEVFVATTTTNELYGFDDTGEILSGWPVSIESDNPDYDSAYSPPTIGDIDGDGDKEIVVGRKTFTSSGPTTTIYVFSANGELLNPEQWPVTVSGWSSLTYFEILMADLNNDGTKEIVFTDGLNIHVLQYNGLPFSDWPLTLGTSGATYLPVLLSDVNSDGYPEIITMEKRSYGNYDVCAYDMNKQMVPGFPIRTSSPNGDTYVNALAIADVDGDDKAELVVSVNGALGFESAFMKGCNYNIFIYDLDCSYDTSINQWPYFRHDPCRTGDMSDRKPPVVTITSPEAGRTYYVSSIVVAGEVTDNKSEITSVSINGEAADVIDGVFSHTLSGLDEGENVIKVTAQDENGNIGAASITITIDTIPPPPPTPYQIIADNYNDDYPDINSFGFWTGGNPDGNFIMEEIYLDGYERGRVKKFTYACPTEQDLYWYTTNVWDDINFLDISYFNYLSFYVKGEEGGEDFYIQIQYGDPLQVSEIHSSDYFTVTDTWKKVNVPLMVFDGLDKTKVRAIRLEFRHDLLKPQGTIYLDNLGFTTFIRKRVLIDDFNDDIFDRNSFLNWTGWGGSDTFEVVDIALHTYGGYKTNNAKKITYNIIEVDEDNWFASNVWDNTFFFDASDFEYLSFWVKGEAGGEDFYIQLQYDEPLIEEEPEEPLSQIHSTDHFTVTTEWQQINVPIEAFTEANKTKLRAVSLGFYYPLTVKQGTIYIDNLEFSNGYGKPESTGPVRVNRETKALLVNGQPYNIKGVGYQPTPIGGLPPHPDDPTMYDRDFPLLVDMGCNTIRIWGTPWDDPDTPEVELNRVNLFNKAQGYGLKVIAGFWMPLYLDYSDFAIRQNIKEDFINFVNAYKDSPALLAWAIGNGNNDILGSNLEYYSFVNELAEIAYCLEGPSYHPVMVVNENLYAIGTYERDADDLQLDYVDVWGSNVFMESYNFAQWFDEEKNYFRVYEDKSTKPLVITSYGTDAFCTTSLDPVDGYEDEAEQEEWVSCNTIEIIKSPDICIGGCVMEYSDEWWKDACDDEGMPEDPYHLSIHDPGGFLEEEWWHDAPDDYANEEYWGIVRIAPDGTWDISDGLDDIEARSVYYSLQELFIGTAPTDPELRYKKYFIKDNWFGRSYMVNGDGEFNPGERIEFQIKLKNTGLTDITGISAVLSIPLGDDYVTILDDGIDFPNMPAGSAVSGPDYFLVEASGDAPYNHTVAFALDITDSEMNLWHEEFAITVVEASVMPDAPVLNHVKDGEVGEGGKLAIVATAYNSAGTELEIFFDIRELSQEMQDNLSTATLATEFNEQTGETFGIFNWKPGSGTVGIYYPVVFVARDELGRCAYQPITITVTSPPEVHYQNHFIIDDWTGRSFMVNGNGKFNPGERVGLQIEVKNTGSAPAMGATGMLSLVSVDSYVTILDDSIVFPDVPGGNTVLSTDNFLIEAAHDTPDNHTVTFALDITDVDERLWHDEFEITVIPASIIPEAPILNHIDDQTVKEWGVLEFTVTATNSAGTELNLFYNIQGLSSKKQKILSALSPATFTTSFNESTGETNGTFRWLPDIGTAGEYCPVIFVAKDELGRSAYQAISINVLPMSSNVLIIDSYNDWDEGKNDLGLWTGWGKNGDGNSIVEEIYLHKYDNGKEINSAKKFTYDCSRDIDYCWYASSLWNNVTPLDISDFDYLSFRVKSEYGNEDFYIKLQFNPSLSQDWILISTSYNDIKVDFSKLTFCDIDADGDYDMFIGGQEGHTTFYGNDGTPWEPAWTLVSSSYNNLDVGSFAIPTFCDIDADGDYDMFVGNGDGVLSFSRNDGTPRSPNWTFITGSYNNIEVGYDSAPAFCDIDADGDYDMFIGNYEGHIAFYRNDGTPQEPAWTSVSYSYKSIDVGYDSAPAFCDIDADGDYDMFIGDYEGHTAFYRNDGTPQEPLWTLVTYFYNGIDVGYDSGPSFCDIDADNDHDMFIGSRDGWITFYRNDETFVHESAKIYSSDYFTVTDEWQQVNIPLTAFSGLNKTAMNAIAIIFDYTISVRQGTIYIDNLEFSKGYGKPESSGSIKIDRTTKQLLKYNPSSGTYEPLFIKGVGYQPVPIGEYPPHPDNPAIYDRDLPLLVDMGCNTIRTWETPWDQRDPRTPDVEINRINLFNKAQEYGLKIIAGFWMADDVDYSNPIVREHVKQLFTTTFVNAYKDSAALLMWAIGNENNYHNGSDLDYYSLCNELAKIAYQLEGDAYHPVMIVNGHLFNMGVEERGAEDLQLNYIDAWGCNAYAEYFNSIDWHGDTRSFFDVYKEKSSKPLIITEYGADAFYTTNHDTLEGYVDEDMQSDWVRQNTLEIMDASDLCFGGCVMEYSDEWWKDSKGDPLDHDEGGFSTGDPHALQEWTLVSTSYINIDVGYRSQPSFCDIDADGDYDMFIGNYDGRIYLYQNDGTSQLPNWTSVSGSYNYIDVGGSSSPTFCDIDADGDYDLFIGEADGYINFYRNDGTSQLPNWTSVSSSYNDIDVGGSSTPTFCDIDADGDYDMFIGNYDGRIYFYQNDGTPQSPDWTWISTSYNDIDVGRRSTPTFCDIDADGDYDMFTGENYGSIAFYRNDGTPQLPDWTFVSNTYAGIDVGNYCDPDFCDIDADGDYDMFIGNYDGNIAFYQNDPPGAPNSLSPDGFFNGEYWGIVQIAPDGTWSDPDGLDDIKMRRVYYMLKALYKENVKPGDSIQAAIDASSEGDFIYVTDGTYEEDISIKDKDNLTLIGDGAESTIIKGNISFEDSDSSAERVSIIYKDGGNLIYSNDHYSDFKLLKDAGITAINSEITVRDCIIMPDLDTINYEGCYDQPLEHYGKGIQIWNLYGSEEINPTIENNLIQCADTGIYLYSHSFDGAINGIIQGNDLQDNTYGIVLRMHKEKPLIDGNTISGSTRDGIHITYEDGDLLTNRLNKISNNHFIGNSRNVFCDELDSEVIPTGEGNVYE